MRPIKHLCVPNSSSRFHQSCKTIFLGKDISVNCGKANCFCVHHRFREPYVPIFENNSALLIQQLELVFRSRIQYLNKLLISDVTSAK